MGSCHKTANQFHHDYIQGNRWIQSYDKTVRNEPAKSPPETDVCYHTEKQLADGSPEQAAAQECLKGGSGTSHLFGGYGACILPTTFKI